jgi:hypothetical protein
MGYNNTSKFTQNPADPENAAWTQMTAEQLTLCKTSDGNCFSFTRTSSTGQRDPYAVMCFSFLLPTTAENNIQFVLEGRGNPVPAANYLGNQGSPPDYVTPWPWIFGCFNWNTSIWDNFIYLNGMAASSWSLEYIFLDWNPADLPTRSTYVAEGFISPTDYVWWMIYYDHHQTSGTASPITLYVDNVYMSYDLAESPDCIFWDGN